MADLAPLMSYVRIYSDAAGASHFQDVTVKAAGAPSAGVVTSDPLPVTGLIFRRVCAGSSPVWHVAPRRQFIVHVAGEVDVEVSDGEVRRFSPGSVVLVEDTHGTGHITRPVNGMPRTTLFIALQEPDGPLG
jgi:hypothetical protein